MGLDLGAIEFYVGPKVLGGPDDLEVVVRDFIAGAKKRLLRKPVTTSTTGRSTRPCCAPALM